MGQVKTTELEDDLLGCADQRGKAYSVQRKKHENDVKRKQHTHVS